MLGMMDHQRPDYDFYSPNACKDAYDHTYAQKYKHVTAIPIQTMRVSVDFIFISDISYVPLTIYKNLPYISHNRMRLIHPYYRILDMHLSFTYPYMGHLKRQYLINFKRYSSQSHQLSVFLGHSVGYYS